MINTKAEKKNRSDSGSWIRKSSKKIDVENQSSWIVTIILAFSFIIEIVNSAAIKTKSIKKHC